MAEATAKKKLAKKIADVIAEVEKLPKDGHNAHFNYDYTTEGAAIDHMRKKLSEHGVLALPTVKYAWQEKREVVTKDGPRIDWHSFVLMNVRLIDTETGEELETEWPGEGMDSMDKGFYKAESGAYKYFLLKTFMIPTGDDPEKDNGSKPAAPRQQQDLPKERGTASQNQLGFIHQLAGELQIEEATITRMKKVYGVESSKELSMADASDFITLLKEAKDYGYSVIDNFLSAHATDPGGLDPETQEYLAGGGDVPNA